MDALLELVIAAQQWVAAHPLETLLIIGFFWAGCPCCGECTPYFSDNFDDDTITGWTQVAETWTETGGKLTIDIDSARIRCDTAHPDGSTSMRVQVDMRVTNTSTQLRLIGGSDGTDYHALRVFFNGSSSEIALIRHASGSDFSLTSATVTLNTDTDYTAYLCLQGGGMVAGIVGVSELSLDLSVQYGDLAELATGAAFGGGTASFDNFSVTRVDAECPGCSADRCDQCTDGITPFEWEIVVSGIAGSPTCTAGGTCADDNGTYIVTIAPVGGVCDEKILSGDLRCCFEYESPTPFCRGSHVYLFVSTVLNANIGFKTAIVNDDFETISDLTPIACADAQNVDCPNFQSGTGYWCDTSSATVTVSALV